MCGSGDRLGPLRDGADHPWRERPLRRRAHPQCRGPDQPPRPVRAALGPLGPATLFTIPVLRYMKTYGLTHEQWAMISVVQREWAEKNPRAIPGRPALRRADPGTPITVEDVLNSRMIAYPFRL